jgi:hypothetical protein
VSYKKRRKVRNNCSCIGGRKRAGRGGAEFSINVLECVCLCATRVFCKAGGLALATWRDVPWPALLGQPLEIWNYIYLFFSSPFSFFKRFGLLGPGTEGKKIARYAICGVSHAD